MLDLSVVNIILACGACGTQVVQFDGSMEIETAGASYTIAGTSRMDFREVALNDESKLNVEY